MENPIVSVIVCGYRTDRHLDLLEAIDSLKAQSYKSIQIILIIDGNAQLYEQIKHIATDPRIEVSLNDKNLGLSGSRNRGLTKVKGDIVAFFDDDAIADKNWILELVKMYQQKEAIAAGGNILPLWLTDEPKCLPGEFYWLIGATYKGFPQDVTEVRNAFGSNLSFRADVLTDLGGFRSEMGVKGKGQLQGEETEICERMRNKFGKGVIYNHNAIVYHKIFPERLKWRFLLRRAFWQGYSKRIMRELGYSLEDEGKFLVTLREGAWVRLKMASIVNCCQLVALVILTSAVGFGYYFRLISSNVSQRP